MPPPPCPAPRRDAHGPHPDRRRALGGLLALACPAAAWPAPPTPLMASELPPEVGAALRRARLPESALGAWVQGVDDTAPRLAWNERQLVNPASLFKLVTTYAALDQMGPAWSWRTPVLLTGPLQDGVLQGDLVIRGNGDPTLVWERVWLLLSRWRAAGLLEIQGDIVLDGSAFALPPGSAADFDGDATRPYNVRPDAALLNYKSLTLRLVPEPDRRRARVSLEPTLSGVSVDGSVPLANGPCEDWRGNLQAQLSDPARISLAGSYATACGEREWPVAYADPASYGARLISQVWQDLGGRLRGQARQGLAPPQARLWQEWVSPPLGQVVRDINKFSNNLMAEQLFLSLALQRGLSPARPEDARQVLGQWLRQHLGDEVLRGWVIDNGSGLSRDTRVTAQGLGRLLLQAYSSPVMSELMSSLPISGQDGTLRRSSAPAGRAHLKTGSLRDVAGVAGYVLSDTGRRHVLVAVLQHERAGAGRPALDALVQWAMADATTPAGRIAPA